MGCRNRELSEDESDVSPSLSDALLFTTMCIIGLPVEVHVKDGSIYTGIFHTACVEKDYGIVLKRARMTKKGKHDANVAIEGLIETLVVLSGDLVQVVAKGVLLPADGVVRNVAGDDVEAVGGAVPSFEGPEGETKTVKYSKSDVDEKKFNKTRRSAITGNGFAHGFTSTRGLEGRKMAPSYQGNSLEVENGKSDVIHSTKSEEAFSAPVNGRQVGDDRSQGERGDYEQKLEFPREETTHEARGSSSNLDACLTQLHAIEEIHEKIVSKMLPNAVPCDSPAPSVVKPDNRCHGRHTSADIPCSDSISSVSTAFTSVVDVSSESCLSSLTTPTEMVPPQSSVSNRSAKEFKLNPGAKTFSPSFANPRSATPPAVPTVASAAYMANNSHMVPVAAAQPEIGVSPFVPRSSLPVKFVQYGNSIAGNGGSGSQYSQPIVGHVGSRTQPVRYTGQYHPVQAGPAYVHPNSQNVMVGRLGQLVYVHPVSHDVVQGAAALSQVSARPLLAPHPVHFPKHQGSAAAQQLQLCVTPPFIAGGQQPVAVAGHIPLSQPSFPAIRPIPVPGSNGLFSTKFP